MAKTRDHTTSIHDSRVLIPDEDMASGTSWRSTGVQHIPLVENTSHLHESVAEVHAIEVPTYDTWQGQSHRE